MMDQGPHSPSRKGSHFTAPPPEGLREDSLGWPHLPIIQGSQQSQVLDQISVNIHTHLDSKIHILGGPKLTCSVHFIIGYLLLYPVCPTILNFLSSSLLCSQSDTNV